MASQVYLREYFDNFPDFHYNPSRGTMAQFYRLAQREGWSKDEFREQKEAIQTALVLQFNETYGESENELQNWRQLCEAMDIEPMPKSVKQCKKLFRRVNVNIVDLVDTKGTGKRVTPYKTVDELADYTKETGKFFPREHVAAGGLLRLLLRQILASGTTHR